MNIHFGAVKIADELLNFDEGNSWYVYYEHCDFINYKEIKENLLTMLEDASYHFNDTSLNLPNISIMKYKGVFYTLHAFIESKQWIKLVINKHQAY